MDNKNENKAKEWFINNIIYFILILISVIYLFTAIFEIAETGKSLRRNFIIKCINFSY